MDHWLAIPHGDWRPFIPIFLAASSFLPYSCAPVQGCCVSNTMATFCTNTPCTAVGFLQQCRGTEEREKRWNKEAGRLRRFLGEQIRTKPLWTFGGKQTFNLNYQNKDFVINIIGDRILLDLNPVTLNSLHPRVISVHVFIVPSSQDLWKLSEVDVHHWRLVSTILIKIYLLLLTSQTETFSTSATAFEALQSARLSSEPFK